MSSGDVEDFEVLLYRHWQARRERRDSFAQAIATLNEDGVALIYGVVYGAYEFVLVGADGVIGEVCGGFGRQLELRRGHVGPPLVLDGQ